MRFEVLHPARASYDDQAVRDNDRSCVLAIDAPGGRVLLPADIERRSEEELLRGARVVVFPVGYRNRFGRPHHEVVRRYVERGARIYRTDRDGAVTIAIHANGTIRVTPFRALYRRYWQTQLESDPVPEP